MALSPGIPRLILECIKNVKRYNEKKKDESLSQIFKERIKEKTNTFKKPQKLKP